MRHDQEVSGEFMNVNSINMLSVIDNRSFKPDKASLKMAMLVLLLNDSLSQGGETSGTRAEALQQGFFSSAAISRNVCL